MKFYNIIKLKINKLNIFYFSTLFFFFGIFLDIIANFLLKNIFIGNKTLGNYIYKLIEFIYQYIFSFNSTIEFSILMGFPKPANEIMLNIIILLSEMTILLTFILFSILLILSYIIDIYNAENNPYPRHFEKTVESTLDAIFVIIPTIIILYLLIPSLGFIFNNETIMETIFSIDIIGHQWYWSYEYNLLLGSNLYYLLPNNIIHSKIEFDSLSDQESTYNRLLQVDKRLIIPVNILIEAKITSQDVIHSRTIPQLGIKYDAIPGRLITFVLYSNIKGIFYGQCSELCGVNHAFTPISLQVVDNNIFLDWILLYSYFNPSNFILNSLILPLKIN